MPKTKNGKATTVADVNPDDIAAALRGTDAGKARTANNRMAAKMLADVDKANGSAATWLLNGLWSVLVTLAEESVKIGQKAALADRNLAAGGRYEDKDGRRVIVMPEGVPTLRESDLSSAKRVIAGLFPDGLPEWEALAAAWPTTAAGKLASPSTIIQREGAEDRAKAKAKAKAEADAKAKAEAQRSPMDRLANALADAAKMARDQGVSVENFLQMAANAYNV